MYKKTTLSKLSKGYQASREIKLLLQFLKAKDASVQFLVNLALSHNHKGHGPYKWFNNLKKLEKHVPPEYYILHAFDWQSTPEKFNYWANLSEDWKLYIYVLDQYDYART